MPFLEIEFPTSISYKAIGGPGFSTTVNAGVSGSESRIRNWKNTRGKWTVGLKTPAWFANRQQFVDLLIGFFMNAGGKANSFRLKDHKSFLATAQPLVTNDDGNVQLAITRAVGASSFVQLISKPITSDVVDYQGNALADTVVLTAGGGAVAVDPTTGLVTGAAAGTLVNFQFHYPVRFDTDELQISIEEAPVDNPVIEWNSIPLLETLPPNF
jgi:uncharacterized protein (TIGR02217 family)